MLPGGRRPLCCQGCQTSWIPLPKSVPSYLLANLCVLWQPPCYHPLTLFLLHSWVHLCLHLITSQMFTGTPCFMALHRYCLFLPTEGLGQSWTKQVYQRHFSNCICSFCVSMSHFDNFHNISTFSLWLYFLWSVKFDVIIAKRLCLRWWLALF